MHIIYESDFTVQDLSDMIDIHTVQEALAKMPTVEANDIDALLDIMDADPDFNLEEVSAWNDADLG